MKNRKCNTCTQLVYDTNPITNKIYASCKLCRKTNVLRRREYRRQNSQLISKQRKNTTQKLRQKVLDMYGRKCMHCCEIREKMLTIDHINNDGGKHRKKINGQQDIMYKEVMKEAPNDI